MNDLGTFRYKPSNFRKRVRREIREGKGREGKGREGKGREGNSK